MSQPQLTNFFSHAKRGTRASTKSSKLLDTGPPEEVIQSKRSTRGRDSKPSTPTSTSPPRKSNKEHVEQAVEKLTNVTEKIQVQAKDINVTLVTNSIEETVETKSDETNSDDKKDVIEEPAPAPVKKSTRGRKKVVDNDENMAREETESCPSPAKRSRSSRGTNKVLEEAVEQAKSLQGQKLTPAQVKERLGGMKGANKLKVLKDQLKNIEKQKQTVKQVQAKAKKLEEKKKAEEAKKEAHEELSKTAAHVTYHNLAQKAETGTLPLPFTYKFLGEVFRCTDTIAAMLHNRKEIVTVDKIKSGVQQMLRKNFNIDYLKQIKTVFPAAYRYAWENIVGRYGKRLSDYELQICVNTNFKNDTISEFGGLGHKEETVANSSDKLGPAGMVERRSIFTNALHRIVKEHHSKFCQNLEQPLEVDETRLTRYHKDFNVDLVPEIPAAEFPEKPKVEICHTAAEVLEKSRALFEVNPKLAESLAKVADKKEAAEEVAKPAPTPVPAAPVRKELKGLPAGLLEKIRAKEAAKAAREMFGDKEKEEKVKQLRRLPTIARILRNLLISEKKAALPHPFVIKKTLASYPGHVAQETLMVDLEKIVELTSPWAMFHVIQGTKYFKINQGIDINTVVASLNKMLEDEMK